MRERTPAVGPIAAAAAALGICCGIPLLVTLGGPGLVAGLSMTGGTLLVFCALTAVVGGWWLHARVSRTGGDVSAGQTGREQQRVTRAVPEDPHPEEQ